MSLDIRITGLDVDIEQFMRELEGDKLPYLVISKSKPYDRRNSLEKSVYVKLAFVDDERGVR